MLSYNDNEVNLKQINFIIWNMTTISTDRVAKPINRKNQINRLR